jgi:putative hydrolase of the HAD superfamily
MGLRYIIFDLDDTLYPRSSGLMQEIGRRIQTWVQRRFDLTWEEAMAMRRDYFLRYGTTLGGLIAEHAVDVHGYLLFVHDIPVEDYLSPDPALAAMLRAIPQRKAVYTNGTAEYAHRVLRALDIASHFERVIGVEDVGLRSKAYREAYERVLALLEAQGSECMMVEDMPQNLCQPKTLGMTTVLVSAESELKSDHCVDFVVSSVLDVEHVARTLSAGMAEPPR